MYRPWVNRRFGVEMELRDRTVNDARIGDAQLRRAVQMGTSRLNSRAAGYYHSDGNTWDVKTDASCGWEVASPALTLDEVGENAELKAVCEGLKTLTPRIDRTCGLHVHVECRDFTWQDAQKLISLWMRFEPFFFEMLPPSRRGNHYCTPLFRDTWTTRAPSSHTLGAVNARTGQEFQREAGSMVRGALHMTQWWRTKRVEFRLHSGTIDYEKIRQWVMLLLSVVQRVKQGDMMGEVDTIRDWSAPWLQRTVGFDTKYVCRVLGLVKSKVVPEVPAVSATLVTWIDNRRRRFGPQRIAGDNDDR